MADEDVILASVSTIAVAAARKRRRRNRLCWVRDFKVVLQRTFLLNQTNNLCTYITKNAII